MVLLHLFYRVLRASNIREISLSYIGKNARLLIQTEHDFDKYLDKSAYTNNRIPIIKRVFDRIVINFLMNTTYKNMC